MKRFEIPRMERINLVSQMITVASYCGSKYCRGYTCPVCEDPIGQHCDVVQPCYAHHCECYLCHDYEGTGTTAC